MKYNYFLFQHFEWIQINELAYKLFISKIFISLLKNKNIIKEL